MIVFPSTFEKSFTVTIISYLPMKTHSEMTANIESHFLSHYQHRLQSDLQGRGLYGITQGDLQVHCSIAAFQDPSMDDFTRREVIANGDAFIILHDERSSLEADALYEKITNEDRGKLVPVFRKMIETSSRKSKVSFRCGCCREPTDELITDMFETLCFKVKLDAGFIAPPKRAKRCVRQSIIKRVISRLVRRMSIR